MERVPTLDLTYWVYPQPCFHPNSQQGRSHSSRGDSCTGHPHPDLPTFRTAPLETLDGLGASRSLGFEACSGPLLPYTPRSGSSSKSQSRPTHLLQSCGQPECRNAPARINDSARPFFNRFPDDAPLGDSNHPEHGKPRPDFWPPVCAELILPPSYHLLASRWSSKSSRMLINRLSRIPANRRAPMPHRALGGCDPASQPP